METPPGQVFQRDFRQHPGSERPEQPSRPIKLLQWNIERGYQLAGIIEELRRIDADIISLQEVDVGCDRSGGADTGVAIAQALGLNYAFFCEFEELRSPLRDARSQGGGVHGNAILSKWPFSELAVVRHRHHPVDWNNPAHPLARREPRRGERAVLRAVVETPQGPVVVYNAHLEVFCGLLARIAQLADIFADARSMADRGFQHQAILGDMNTMAHGIARLSPHYCTDHMRYRSIGMDEAAVWHRHVLPVLDPRYALGSGSGSAGSRRSTLASPAASTAAAATGAGSGRGSSITGAHLAASRRATAGAAAPEAAAGAVAPKAAAEAAAKAAAGTAGEAALDATAAGPAFGGQQPHPPHPPPPQQQQQQQQQQQPLQQQPAEPQVHQETAAPINPQLLAWGLSAQVARDATNPGFADPFHPSTTTLDNPAYRWFGLSLMKGKLDWVLLRRMRATAQAVGNDDYSLSDHKWLAAEVDFD